MFKTAEEARDYIFAGNATVTLKSLKTGTHFTYKIRKSDDGGTYFVRLLVNPDDYRYLGCVFDNRRDQIRITAKSCAGKDASSVKAINYTLGLLCQGHLNDLLEIKHEGTCGRCGRALTHPESIDRGIGPECAKYICSES